MSLLDFIFPRNCLGCSLAGSYICTDCINKVRQLRQICPVCQKPSIDGFTHASCITPMSLDGLTSVWKYEKVIRSSISAIKYKFARDVARELSGYTKTWIEKMDFIFKDFDNIVPIPLYWYKENFRGFNQSSLLAIYLSLKLKTPVINEVLVKTRYSHPQVGLSAIIRKTNIKNSFIITKRDLLKGKKIIVFDDVYTTGSTLKEAGKVLKRAGASKVWAFTIAR